MPTIEQRVSDACDFLHRFLSGERGFTTTDVLAGIARLRRLEAEIPNEATRVACRSIVREVCQKLERFDDNWKWSQAPS